MLRIFALLLLPVAALAQSTDRFLVLGSAGGLGVSKSGAYAVGVGLQRSAVSVLVDVGSQRFEVDPVRSTTAVTVAFVPSSLGLGGLLGAESASTGGIRLRIGVLFDVRDSLLGFGWGGFSGGSFYFAVRI